MNIGFLQLTATSKCVFELFVFHLVFPLSLSCTECCAAPALFLTIAAKQMLNIGFWALTTCTDKRSYVLLWLCLLSFPRCTHFNFTLCGMCFYVTALGFSMMATVMTVNPLGNDLSSCLHSSCTAPPCPGGHAAVASISPASWSECYTLCYTTCNECIHSWPYDAYLLYSICEWKTVSVVLWVP